jgi:hypothetical protein
MKELLYRLPSSRSFIRLLSTLTFAVVAFAALELFFAQQALAGIVCCTNSAKTDCLCDSSTVCNITRNGKFYGTRDGLRTCWNLNSYGSASQIKSTITCENANGTGTTTLDLTSFTQNALLKCEVTDSLHDDVGLCQFDLQYSKSGLRTCDNNNPSTATWQAFCSEATGGNPALTVTGTLKCPATLQPPPNGSACAPGTEFGDSPNGCGLPVFCDGQQDCILNLGIDGVSPGQCATVFPVGTELVPPVPGLLAGEVLRFSQTIQNSGCGPDNQVLAFGLLETNRYCSSGLFANDPGLPVDCTPNQGPPLTGLGLSQSAVQFDVKFFPTSLNINCGTNNNDTWHFDITANQHLPDLTRIVVDSLAVEGKLLKAELGGDCDPVNTTVVPNTRTCHVNACQQNQNLTDLGTVVCNANPGNRANLTVTGTLDTLDGIPIFGEDLNKRITGQCQPL